MDKDLIQVFVKFSKTGKTLQVGVHPSKDTCFDLKQKITQSLLDKKDKSHEPNQQLLVFLGIILQDARKLSDYNILQDSTILVSIKPPSEDILEFDACKSCHYQAVDPCALPCGHSCCKTCILVDATACPVAGCDSPLNGLSRDHLMPNWLANHFFDAKATKPTQNCQICAEDGTDKNATHWCESCSKAASGIEYFCASCVATEHSSRTNRDHIRVLIEKNASVPECPKHKLPQDAFCFDENVLICLRCRDEDHKPHETKLVVDCEEQIKAELKSSLAVLTDMKGLEKEENYLKKTKHQKREEIDRLEQEIVLLEVRSKKIEENKIKYKSALLVLLRSIDEYPTKDLFDSKKLSILRLRVEQTLKLWDNASRRPVLKKQYNFKAKFGGPGTGNGQFSNPHGIAIEPFTGNLFIVDAGNHRIQAFQNDGTFIRVFGTKGDGDGQYSSPTQVAFDFAGNLVVCDSENHRIQVVDPRTGEMKLKFGVKGRADGQLSSPLDVTTDKFGNLVVTDASNHRIQVFSPTGSFIRRFGSLGTGLNQLQYPSATKVDDKGNTLVCDRNNHRIVFIDQNGNSAKIIGEQGNANGQFSSPAGVTVDSKGNFVVCDQTNHRVQIFGVDGQFMMKWGTYGQGDGQMHHPAAVAIDNEGNIIVADYSNHRVCIFG